MNLLDLKEKAIHGTPDFPVAIYESQWDIPYQWHNEEEIIYILDGQANYNISGETIFLQKGDCAFCPGRKLHSMFLSDRQNVRFRAILFDKTYLFSHNDVCNKLFDKNIHINRIFRSTDNLECAVTSIVERLCYIMDQKEYGYQLEVKMLLTRIYYSILQNKLYRTSEQLPHDEADKNIISAIGYIHANYAHKITVDELAAVTGYSTPYFQSFFKIYTYQTPIEYIILYRLKKACEMLRETDLNITAISEACGFFYTSYFIRKFKSVYGITPHRYRGVSIKKGQ